MTRLAVITGTSRGIGAGIAAAAAASAAVVAVCNRTPTGGQHELVADLSDPATWSQFARWYDELVAEVAPDEVAVIHNSATLTPIGLAGDVDPEAHQRLVLLDSAAPQVLGEAVMATARARSCPTVLLQLSSGAASTPFSGWSGYCAAKAAVEMWVQTVALELEASPVAGVPIRVAAVRPGVVATDMQAEIRSSDPSAFPDVERFQGLHRSGALADPTEVGAKIWAATEDPTWANGVVLNVAG